MYLLRPEGPPLLLVLQIVPDDVGLLEEQTHGVGQLRVPAHLNILQLGRREESGQADPHQTRHVMTVLQGNCAVKSIYTQLDRCLHHMTNISCFETTVKHFCGVIRL